MSSDTRTGINIAILIGIAVGARLIYMFSMIQKANAATTINPAK